VATGPFYTRELGAVHKTERLNAILGSVAPQTPINVPSRPPGLLVELALHHGNYLGQPLIADILGAED
jgi:hypothetical protein